MKISIFSFAVNDKFPIDIMYRQFTKYMKEDFELILFNDAMDAESEAAINLVTSYNGIKCVRVPQNIHKIQNPSEGYAATLNWAVQNYAVQNNCEIVVLLHSDIFPIHDVNISNIIEDNIVASTTEYKILNGDGIIYFYPAFTIINMTLLQNVSELDFGLEPGLDVGGKTKDFIKNNQKKIKFLENSQILNYISTAQNTPLLQYFRDDLAICGQHGLSAGWVANGFYHYMAGSQWNSYFSSFAEGHKKRMNLFLKYFY